MLYLWAAWKQDLNQRQGPWPRGVSGWTRQLSSLFEPRGLLPRTSLCYWIIDNGVASAPGISDLEQRVSWGATCSWELYILRFPSYPYPPEGFHSFPRYSEGSVNPKRWRAIDLGKKKWHCLIWAWPQFSPNWISGGNVMTFILLSICLYVSVCIHLLVFIICNNY